MIETLADPELELVDDIASLAHDPVRFVDYCYPWGRGGLQGFEGAYPWQAKVLRTIRDHLSNPETRFQPLRIALSSGKAIGKTALLAFVESWARSTCGNCRGQITANTLDQLRSKSWPEMSKWNGLAINSHWWEFGATSITSRQEGYERTWRTDQTPWSENNIEAFQGLHNRGRRVLVIFDEASGIADAVWDAAEAAQTDEGTETIWLAFSNPTRKDGRFYEVAFGSRSHRWKTFCIDSRDVPGTNKQQIAEWEQDHGENSDFFRVWVRGLPPITGDIQFIDSDRVWEAQKREVLVLPDEPLILGIDLARGGEDDNVLRYRRGQDARSIPPIRIPGAETRDSTVMIAKIADEVRTRRPDAVFLDETGGSIGGPIGDRLRLLGINVIPVQFGGASPDEHYANQRAYMWALGREWLSRGAIDKDPKLEAALCGPGYSSDRHDKLVLESKESMKKRGLRSPDDADALFLTFAQKVMPKPRQLEPDRWSARAHDLAGELSWMR